MNIEVLYTRGSGIYVVKYKDTYYLVNTEKDFEPQASEYVDSFLRFGYFEEVNSISDEEKLKIENKLAGK